MAYLFLVRPEESVIMLPDIAFFVALERRVWQALANGDIEADVDYIMTH